jgi:uncharacterized membrane protein YbaN (DUF454 family)
MAQPGSIRRVSSFRKAVFVVAGTISLGLGALGIFVPVLPTTPFLLLSAALYYRGSERMHRWLLNNKLFGNYIRNYKEGRGMTLEAKALTLCLLWTTICYSAFYLVTMTALQIVLFVIASGVSIHILTIPTFRRSRV